MRTRRTVRAETLAYRLARVMRVAIRHGEMSFATAMDREGVRPVASQDIGDLIGPDNPTEERPDGEMPGGGAGRRDEVGHTGVYPYSASQGASGDAPAVAEGALGQGDRGVEGYQDSGDSGLDATFDRETAAAPGGELTGDTPADQAGAGGI